VPDENGNPTPEERFAPKLPKQLQDQVDAANAFIASQEPPLEPEEGADGEGESEGESDELEFSFDPQPEPPDEPDSWERRARSAAGRLEQALTANQTLSRQVSELQRQIDGLKLRGAEGPAPPAAPAPRQPLVKPEEVNDYGDEFFDVVGRRARDEIEPKIETLEQRLARLEQGQQIVSTTIAKSQVRSVYEQLNDEIGPEWDNINHHPVFHQWLGQPDPYSGRTRKELLNEAFTRHDGNRVVNFFRGFAEAVGLPLTPGQAPEAPQGHKNGNGSGRPTLEQFAAPGRARSGQQPLPPEKPTYTRAYVTQLSDQKRRGLWRGREAELLAIEQDIFQAQHEGRLT